jgi:hypothetical protein
MVLRKNNITTNSKIWVRMDSFHFWKLDPDPRQSQKSDTGPNQSQNQELWRLKWSRGGPWMLTMEAWRLKTEPYPDPPQVKSRIRIRIIVFRIRNTAIITIKN